MKDSKEKEHRISNLKDMIDNVKEDEEGQKFDDIEEDEELIKFLKADDSIDFDSLEVDDEYIYHPGDEREYAVELDENPVDEEYLIKTPSEEAIEKGVDTPEVEDIVGEMGDNLDSLLNVRLGRTPVLAFVSGILGAIMIFISIFIFESRSDRVIDNVASGETNFISVIVLAIGILLLAYGVYRIFNIKNPIKGMTESINQVDHAEKVSKDVAEETSKSNKTDDDTYKIGEFGLDELKSKLKRTKKTEKPTITEEDFDNIPPAREKEESKKGLTAEEIEDIEYNQVKLDNETIDDIFAEVDDIDEEPVISTDSKDKR